MSNTEDLAENEAKNASEETGEENATKAEESDFSALQADLDRFRDLAELTPRGIGRR